MRLTFHDNRFVFLCTFENRGIPKQAKFLWDQNEKLWYTTQLNIAARLREFADHSAKTQINRTLLVNEPWTGQLKYPEHLSPLPFQKEDAIFALERNRSYLALDPGLGKTIIAALIINALPKHFVYYICPPSLEETVKYELEKWGADFSRLMIMPDSMIIKERTQSHIQKIHPSLERLLIVDEAHRFKNMKSKRTKVLFKSFVPFFHKAVFMSGTPMPNRPIELYPVLNHCAPETIGFKNLLEYGERYCDAYKSKWGWDFSGASNVAELAKNVKEKFMRRRKKEEVLKELPPKTEELVLIGDNLPATLADVDRGILREFSPEDLMGGLAPNGHLSTYRKELGKAKVRPALEFIKSILEETDEYILIFTLHKAVIADLLDSLMDYQPLWITGDTPIEARQLIVDEFQEKQLRRVFIGNIDACGLGFTLTRATRVIFVEFSWVPAANDQASDRAHRIGQKDNVLVQYLVFKNSIDRAVMETILRKRNITKHI